MGIEKYPKHFDHATQVISAFLIELERSIPNASELVEIIYCPLPMYPGKNDDHSVLENDCLKRISHMKIDYLNLSIEGINPDPEEQLNLSKISESTIITVAAGNSGTNIKSYPCSYEMKNKVCVGNVGPNFKIHKTSTRNAEVNVYELGVNVLVYISTSLQLYETSGTSFSAPLHLAHLIRDAQLGRIYDYKTSIQKFKIANSLAAPQRVPAGLDK
jgi:subtilisin family serine protease